METRQRLGILGTTTSRGKTERAAGEVFNGGSATTPKKASAAISGNLALAVSFLLGCFVSLGVVVLWIGGNNVERGTLSPPPPGYGAGVGGSASLGQDERGGAGAQTEELAILVAIASYDFSQLPHLEEVLDGYFDLCAFSSTRRVDVYVHTTVPYPVLLIDLLNTRFRSPTAKFSLQITLVSPSIKLNLVDLHRTLFYNKLDEYDLFIYSEDDIRLSPRTVWGYWEHTQRIRQLLGSDEEAANYNVGVVRYEYNYPPDVIIDDKTRHAATEGVSRVYWEHAGRPVVPDAADLTVPAADKGRVPSSASKLQGDYVYMRNHHQGLFLATPALLRAWRDRPKCDFDRIRQRPGLRDRPSQPTEGTQRVWMSSHMLHGGRHCNVRQLIPMDQFGRFTVLHLPNKNYRRVGKKGRLGGYANKDAPENLFADGTERFEGAHPDLLTAAQLHVELYRNYVLPNAPTSRSYSGPITMVDETDWKRNFSYKERHQALVQRRMDAYRVYVRRGGILSEEDLNFDWGELSGPSDQG